MSIPTLEGGKKVKLRVPPGTRSHQLFRLKGRGITNLHGQGRGDQIVRVVIQVPRKLTEKQKSLLREFSDLSGEPSFEPTRSFVDRIEDKVRDFFSGE